MNERYYLTKHEFMADGTIVNLFYTVVNHLMAQAEQSMDSHGCAYRGDEGKKCAVGCLISDEDYSANLEGRTVFDPQVQEALPVQFRTPEALKLLAALQLAHDNYKPEHWPKLFYGIGLAHGISAGDIYQVIPDINVKLVGGKFVSEHNIGEAQ